MLFLKKIPLYFAFPYIEIEWYKMYKKFIAIGIMLLFLMVWLSGCNEILNTFNQENKKFIGSWKSNYFTITLFSNGSGYYDSRFINWEVNDTHLFIYSIINGTKIKSAYEYTFLENNTKLRLYSVHFTFQATFIKQ